jgi:YHS domain-containing protein
MNFCWGAVTPTVGRAHIVMTISLRLPRYFVILAFASTALAACGSIKTDQPGPVKTEPSTAPSVGAQSNLTLVTDVSQVCMVNNHFMGSSQIPVQVSGKTYYGCCAMCKARLESDASARTAIDPVSHTPVDKATATIGKTPNGAVVYFASRDHFDSYARQAQTL